MTAIQIRRIVKKMEAYFILIYYAMIKSCMLLYFVGKNSSIRYNGSV